MPYGFEVVSGGVRLQYWKAQNAVPGVVSAFNHDSSAPLFSYQLPASVEGQEFKVVRELREQGIALGFATDFVDAVVFDVRNAKFLVNTPPSLSTYEDFSRFVSTDSLRLRHTRGFIRKMSVRDKKTGKWVSVRKAPDRKEWLVRFFLPVLERGTYLRNTIEVIVANIRV